MSIKNSIIIALDKEALIEALEYWVNEEVFNDRGANQEIISDSLSIEGGLDHKELIKFKVILKEERND